MVVRILGFSGKRACGGGLRGKKRVYLLQGSQSCLMNSEIDRMYESFKSFKFDTYSSQACLHGLSRYLSREEAGLHQIFS